MKQKFKPPTKVGARFKPPQHTGGHSVPKTDTRIDKPVEEPEEDQDDSIIDDVTSILLRRPCRRL